MDLPLIYNSLSTDIHPILAVWFIFEKKKKKKNNNSPLLSVFVHPPLPERVFPKEAPEPTKLFLSAMAVADVYLPSSIILTQSA